MRSFIASLVACRSDLVDDVLQSTSLSAWRKLDTFSYVGETPDEELIRWMCTVARFRSTTPVAKVMAAFDMDVSTIDVIAECYAEQSEALEDRFNALKTCWSDFPRLSGKCCDFVTGKACQSMRWCSAWVDG